MEGGSSRGLSLLPLLHLLYSPYYPYYPYSPYYPPFTPPTPPITTPGRQGRLKAQLEDYRKEEEKKKVSVCCTRTQPLTPLSLPLPQPPIYTLPHSTPPHPNLTPLHKQHARIAPLMIHSMLIWTISPPRLKAVVRAERVV